MTGLGFAGRSRARAPALDSVVPPACSPSRRRTPTPSPRSTTRTPSACCVFLMRRVLDVDTAFDLLSETFATALERRRQFRGGSAEEEQGWLFSIARCELSHYWRDGRVERIALARLGVAVPGAERPGDRADRAARRASTSSSPALQRRDGVAAGGSAARGRAARRRGARLRRGGARSSACRSRPPAPASRAACGRWRNGCPSRLR